MEQVSDIGLEAVGSNRWLLRGQLVFATIPGAWRRLEPLLSVAGPLELSLAGVTRSNSAALALLLQGLEQAHISGCQLKYVDLPTDLQALAQMSNCEKLLIS